MRIHVLFCKTTPNRFGIRVCLCIIRKWYRCGQKFCFQWGKTSPNLEPNKVQAANRPEQSPFGGISIKKIEAIFDNLGTSYSRDVWNWFSGGLCRILWRPYPIDEGLAIEIRGIRLLEVSHTYCVKANKWGSQFVLVDYIAHEIAHYPVIGVSSTLKKQCSISPSSLRTFNCQSGSLKPYCSCNASG